MNLSREVIGGLATLVLSSVIAHAVPTHRDSQLDRYLESRAPPTCINESLFEKGTIDLAFSGEPMRSTVLRSQDANENADFNGMNGYLLTLDDGKSKVGFLFVGTRKNVERLRDEMLGAEVAQVFIRNYKKDGYLQGKGRANPQKNDLLDSVDCFYGKPVELKDCMISTYGRVVGNAVVRKIISFDDEK